MSDSARLKYLRVALVLSGLIFVFGIYPLMQMTKIRQIGRPHV